MTDSDRKRVMALMAFAARGEDVAEPASCNDARPVAAAFAASADFFETCEIPVLGRQLSGDMRVVAPREG